MGRKEKMKAERRKMNQSHDLEATVNDFVSHPAFLTIKKLEQEIAKMTKYAVEHCFRYETT